MRPIQLKKFVSSDHPPLHITDLRIWPNEWCYSMCDKIQFQQQSTKRIQEQRQHGHHQHTDWWKQSKFPYFTQWHHSVCAGEMSCKSGGEASTSAGKWGLGGRINKRKIGSKISLLKIHFNIFRHQQKDVNLCQRKIHQRRTQPTTIN